MKLTIREDMTVDIRTIADGFGIERRSAMRLLKRYQKDIEAVAGRVRFEIAVKKGPQRGLMPQAAYLTEDQATAFATLCQNTAEVVRFKMALVAAFAEAKRRITATEPTQEQIERYLSNRYLAHTRPSCGYGERTRDGRPRTGWRRPTYTACGRQAQMAREVAAALLVMQQYLPGFQQAIEEAVK